MTASPNLGMAFQTKPRWLVFKTSQKLLSQESHTGFSKSKKSKANKRDGGMYNTTKITIEHPLAPPNTTEHHQTPSNTITGHTCKHVVDRVPVLHDKHLMVQHLVRCLLVRMENVLVLRQEDAGVLKE